MFRITSTSCAPKAIGPYSQAISANNFLFLSGQIALAPETGKVDGSAVEEQADRCCRNIQAILEKNGLTFENVVKTTCFLADTLSNTNLRDPDTKTITLCPLNLKKK